MDHNLNVYQIGLRYFLCLMCGMIGGLSYAGSNIFGLVFLTLSVVFFLEGILAFDPIFALLGKGDAKSSKKDFN